MNGGDTLKNSTLIPLLKMHGFAMFIFMYIDIFINLYIWNENKELSSLAIFNLLSFWFLPFFFWLGTHFFIRYGFQNSMRFFSFYSLFSFILFYFISHAIIGIQLIIIAISISIIKGFYYGATNVASSILAKDNEFVPYFSYQNIIRHIVSIFLPIASAYIIIRWDMKVSFIVISFLIFIFLLSISKLPTVHMATKTKIHSLIDLFKNKTNKYYMTSSFLTGFFQQFIIFYSVVLTFEITDNAIYVGILYSLYALLTFFSFKFYKITSFSDTFWIIIGIIFIFIACLFIYFTDSMWILIVSNVLFILGIFFFDSINKTQHFQMIHQKNDSEKASLLLYREIFLNIGRCIALFGAYFINSSSSDSFFIFMMICIITGLLIPFINHFYLQYIKKTNN